jgi:uncharacterized membrane protein
MGDGSRRVVSAVFLFIAAFAFVSAASADVSEFEVEFTSLTVYRDGLVHVAQTVAVNETVPSFALRLLSDSESIENLVVVDENLTVLDYNATGQDITIYSLGAKTVLLEYDTASLTRKEAEVWTLAFGSPYNLSVLLPEGSTIFDFSEMPASIEINDGMILLSLSPGIWEISYVVPIVQPADFSVSELRVDPTQIYVGGEVTISVRVANGGGARGSYTVVLKIDQSTLDSETVTLGAGESTTVEFRVTEQNPGTYDVDVNSLTAEFSVKAASQFPFLEIAAVCAAWAVVLLFFFLKRRGSVSVEKIFRSNPYLRDEDKAVILFIAEKGGKTFEAEIRERFPDMPRTSLWRLVKRLEKMEIVKVRRVGLENQVELKK